MKPIVALISSLIVGLALVATSFSPGHEIYFLISHKRRLLMTVATAVTGYIFLVAALLIGLIEWALQSEAQGFVMWSALFTSAIWLAVGGAFALLVAWALMPERPVRSSRAADIQNEFDLVRVLHALPHLFGAEEGQRSEKTGRAARSSEENKFDEAERRPQDAIFRETPMADVFQH